MVSPVEMAAREAFKLISVVDREAISQKTHIGVSEVERKYKFIYIHIPKCAGNAILGSLFGEEGFGHSEAKQIKKMFPDEFRDFHSVAVVRDPIKRFESAYYYLMQGGKGKNDIEFRDKVLAKFDCLEKLVEAMSKDVHLAIKVMRWTHFKPQWSFICDGHGQVLVDQIIRMESLEEGYILFAKSIGLERVPLLRKINSSDKVSRDPITGKAKAIISKLYSEDIRLLGYEV